MGQPATTRRPRRAAEGGSAKELAYDYLKSHIAGIELREGRFITEAEVASELGVSRTPVREAFLRLEAEGLLQLVPQKGAFVPPISVSQMSDVMETRELIEVHCARKVARERSELGEALRRLLEEQQQLTDDVEAFITCDRSFHERIVDAAGNTMLTQLYQALRDRQLRMGIRAVVAGAGRAQSVIAEHRQIVDALESGHERRAEAAVREHLRNTLDILRREQGM